LPYEEEMRNICRNIANIICTSV